MNEIEIIIEYKNNIPKDVVNIIMNFVGEKKIKKRSFKEKLINFINKITCGPSNTNRLCWLFHCNSFVTIALILISLSIYQLNNPCYNNKLLYFIIISEILAIIIWISISLISFIKQGKNRTIYYIFLILFIYTRFSISFILLLTTNTNCHLWKLFHFAEIWAFIWSLLGIIKCYSILK